MKSPSLKTALLRSITLPLIAYIVVIGGFAYHSTINRIDEVYDANLITAANVLLAITGRELAEADNQDLSDLDIFDQPLTPQEREVMRQQADWRSFRIWYNGKLAMTSDSDMWVGVKAFKTGFTNTTYEGKHWRVYALSMPSEHVSVEVGEQRTARRYLVASIVENLIWPLLLSLPLAAWLFARALEFGLNGLRRVTRQINTRSPELMAPLTTTHIPADLVPLVDALNSLLGTLSDSLQREQQLTDHAAHELRTPLAALKLQCQLASRAKSIKEREEALDALLTGVDRMSHVIDQLLALARIKNQHYAFETIDIMQTVRQAASSLQPLLDQRHMSVSIKGEALFAHANAQLLEMLLINIIDNAAKYSPEHSVIKIEGMKEDGKAILRITDEGPGIEESEHERVFERFYRIEGTQASGSGLGLAIARQCVECMGGGIKLFTPVNKQGLGIRITLPVA